MTNKDEDRASLYEQLIGIPIPRSLGQGEVLDIYLRATMVAAGIRRDEAFLEDLKRRLEDAGRHLEEEAEQRLGDRAIGAYFRRWPHAPRPRRIWAGVASSPCGRVSLVIVTLRNGGRCGRIIAQYTYSERSDRLRWCNPTQTK
jgi:hypothetical protein